MRDTTTIPLLLLLLLYVAHAQEQPNFLFILGDDIGWGDIGYMEKHHVKGASGKEYTVNPPKTPNLDAWASEPGSLVFLHHYSASPVCSPTRSSIMSGRSPDRECIYYAEGCGQKPAYQCSANSYPFPNTTYTVSQAVRSKNYHTAFIGKWHLGDFWVKDFRSSGYASDKWKSSNPSHIGFDYWWATEASAESSTPNCGCLEEWKSQSDGCIVGGGNWTKSKALPCTNYWSSVSNSSENCLNRETTSRECVQNSTTKIAGDDTEVIVNYFKDFLSKKPKDEPFLALLFLHTNHVPHYAMPQFYYGYKDRLGHWAGDYLGTLTQMDNSLKELNQVLTDQNLKENTLVWFTTDNGAHANDRSGGTLSAVNGLRQCKASVFEGGIRVPGFLSWPKKISGNPTTEFTVVTSDFMPTVLDILGLKYPSNWTLDGLSLLPLIEGRVSQTDGRQKPLGFSLLNQKALILDEGVNETWKIVYKPKNGFCAWIDPVRHEGPYLFKLSDDPQENTDLCSQEEDQCKKMKQLLEDYTSSLTYSSQHESQCKDFSL